MQPVPRVTRADVERVARRDFPPGRVAEVLAVLRGYGTEGPHREPHRVRLAVLKLAAGSVERLRVHVEAARCDYRDVIAWAEYPGYSRHAGGGDLPSGERQRIVDADWRQYRDWLAR